MVHDERTRLEVARLAAQLMYERLEVEFAQAKRKAARQLGLGPRALLPSNAEIQEMVEELARIHEDDDERLELLASLRVAALWLMRRLEAFNPRLLGDVLEGKVREGSAIALHVFCDDLSELTRALDQDGFRWKTELKPAGRGREAPPLARVLIFDRYDYELTAREAEEFRTAPKNPVTGKTMERASAAELEALLRREHPDRDLQAEFQSLDEDA
jgi:hypothetical protein